jgi:biotin carboxyl carrier protein
VRYFVTFEGVPEPDAPATTAAAVDVDAGPNGALRVSIDGASVEVDAVVVGDRLSVRVDGRIVDLAVKGELPELAVSARGRWRSAQVESERARSAAAAAGGGGGSRAAAGAAGAESVVRSPMPGRVLKILVAEGDAVKAGQGLVVLEAMKMENEVRARGAGVVTRISVAAGTAVDRGTALVVLA